MRRLDRVLGIGLGILLGIGIVVIFVFFGSEGTIDAPRIDEGSTTTTQGHHVQKPRHHPHHGGSPKPSPEPQPVEVPISGGAPPSSGPAHFDFKQGDRVRLRVKSDTAVDLQLLGYGITTTAEASRATQIAFTASKTGNFPLIVSTSHIAVAQIRVDPR
jgi:hypothetical protein